MAEYSYKVIAVLKDDLDEEKLQKAISTISDLKSRLHIINLDDITYIKEQPFEEHQDFGAVTFFFCGLEKLKESFSRLEWHDVWLGRTKIAV